MSETKTYGFRWKGIIPFELFSYRLYLYIYMKSTLYYGFGESD